MNYHSYLLYLCFIYVIFFYLKIYTYTESLENKIKMKKIILQK